MGLNRFVYLDWHWQKVTKIVKIVATLSRRGRKPSHKWGHLGNKVIVHHVHAASHHHLVRL